MKILVTGSEGFIGKNLQERIKLLDYYLIDVKTNCDIRMIDKIDYVPDVVIHLAAETSVFNTDSYKIVDTNIYSFIKMVKFAQKHNARFIYASSSSAFNTTSMYGLSKKFNEDYCAMYYHEAVGLRFHNVYGKFQREDTLLGRLMTQDAVKLFNNGDNIRHFTHVNDIIDAILHFTTNQGFGGLINVYNPSKDSVINFTIEASKHIPFKVKLSSEIRKFDKVEQFIDHTLPFFKTDYLDICKGLSLTFGKI